MTSKMFICYNMGKYFFFATASVRMKEMVQQIVSKGESTCQSDSRLNVKETFCNMKC